MSQILYPLYPGVHSLESKHTMSHPATPSALTAWSSARSSVFVLHACFSGSTPKLMFFFHLSGSYHLSRPKDYVLNTYIPQWDSAHPILHLCIYTTLQCDFPAPPIRRWNLYSLNLGCSCNLLWPIYAAWVTGWLLSLDLKKSCSFPLFPGNSEAAMWRNPN